MTLRIGEPLVVGGTYRLSPGGENPEGTLTALLKDGVTWDLTSATVSLLLKKPDGTTLTRSASIAAPATAGIAYYDTLTTDLDVAGIWHRSWKIVQAPITLYTSSIEFEVTAAP